MQKGKPLSQTVMYLEEINNPEAFVADYDNPDQLLILENLRRIFLTHSCNAVKKAALKFQVNLGEGLKPKQVIDERAGISMVVAGKAHTYYWVFQNFLEKIYTGTKNERVRSVLIKVLQLYGVEKILEFGGAFFESGTITAETLKQCQVAKERLLK